MMLGGCLLFLLRLFLECVQIVDVAVSEILDDGRGVGLGEGPLVLMVVRHDFSEVVAEVTAYSLATVVELE